MLGSAQPGKAQDTIDRQRGYAEVAAHEMAHLWFGDRGAPMSEPMLAVDGLRAWYGAAQILFGLSLQVSRGEVPQKAEVNIARVRACLREVLAALPAVLATVCDSAP